MKAPTQTLDLLLSQWRLAAGSISAAFLLLLPLSSTSRSAEPTATRGGPTPIELRDGDRVAMLGGTFVERLQVYGHLETLITSAYYDRQIGFRNLGWSGDTVWGDARAVFGTQADGFTRLVKDTLEAKPTVILLNYGGNEAYAGPAGVANFVAGLNKLLDALKPSGARVVLLSPMAREHVPAPLPDPTTYNEHLRLYCDALRNVAKQRGLAYVDLYDVLGPRLVRADARGERPVQLTENGLHLSEVGQAVVALRVAERMGVSRPEWNVAIDGAKEMVTARGVAVEDLAKSDQGLTFRATARQLPMPPVYDNRQPVATGHTAQTAQRVRFPDQYARLAVTGLAPGDYQLLIDGEVVLNFDHESLARGVGLEIPADQNQAEELRHEIYDKNILYFHRYRPQNETYLFLFRKHEQGNNAVEIPQFDPLVAEREQRIAELRRPVARKFELRRQ